MEDNGTLFEGQWSRRMAAHWSCDRPSGGPG